MATPSEQFRINLKKLRDARQWTQADMAPMLNHDRTLIARMETGTVGISIDRAVAIAGLFGLTVDDMISDLTVSVALDVRRAEPCVAPVESEGVGGFLAG